MVSSFTLHVCMFTFINFLPDYVYDIFTAVPAAGAVTSLEVRPSTTKYGLVITWEPPSGSNYPTPVTYRVRYRERPSSGPPGSWSSTAERSATQREYTTPILKSGTTYEVEVWAVTSIGNGTSTTKAASTYQCKFAFT